VLAQEQTRIYGPDGRSLGTAAPYGSGSVRYRDPRGRTNFTTKKALDAIEGPSIAWR
jgi:hypothetical protein